MSSNIVVLNGISYVATKHAKARVMERMNLNNNKVDIELYVMELIKSSTENKMIFNNTAYISRLYEKYGTEERFKFLENKECIFVCKEKSPNFYIIVTFYTKETTTKKHFLNRPRYNKNDR